jgi:hypothetical protein
LLTSAISARVAVKRQPATFNAVAPDLFHQRKRLSSLMLFPLRNTRRVPCLEQHLRLHSRRYSGQCSKNRDWRIERFFYTYLSPVGRSAKMPAAFSFQETSTLLANEKSTTGGRDRVSASGSFSRTRKPTQGFSAPWAFLDH